MRFIFFLVSSALVCGWLAMTFGWVAPWLLGPLLAAILLARWQPRGFTLAQRIQPAALAVVGVAISAGASLTTVISLAHAWYIALVAVGITIGMSMTVGLALHHWTGMDRQTAIIGMMPGGASGMAAMSDALGADTPIVTMMQYLRVLSVVITTTLVVTHIAHATPVAKPAATNSTAEYLASLLIAVIGASVALRLRLPAGGILGSAVLGTLAGILGIAHGHWPPGILEAANAIVGISIGLRFDSASLARIRRYLGPILLGILSLIMVVDATSLALAWLSRDPPLTVYMAAAPGAIDSITLIGLGIGADVALIFAINLTRFLVVVALAPPLIRLFRRTDPVQHQRDLAIDPTVAARSAFVLSAPGPSRAPAGDDHPERSSD